MSKVDTRSYCGDKLLFIDEESNASYRDRISSSRRSKQQETRNFVTEVLPFILEAISKIALHNENGGLYEAAQ